MSRSLHDFLSSNDLFFIGKCFDKIDQIRSQTLILRARYYGNTDIGSYPFAKVEGDSPTTEHQYWHSFCIRREQISTGTIDYLDVEVNNLGYLVDNGSDHKKLTPMQNFHCAFVQDCEKSPATWTLYFNGEPVGKLAGSLDQMVRWNGVHSRGYGHVMAGKVRSTTFLSFSAVT